jgi:putative membrane protein
MLLPSLNAILNATSAVLLLWGYIAIRNRRVILHRNCMISAFTVSLAFLASYLYYHLVIRGGQPTRFGGSGEIRTFYLVILVTHTVLAALVAPLAVTTIWLGLSNRLARHKRLARWTLPIWLYVSVTGVIVYWMLYHLYPPIEAALK